MLEKQFSRMGARLRIGVPPNWQIQRIARTGTVVQERPVVRLDVLRDKDGEYFDLRMTPGLKAEVIDVQAKQRHLVLMVRDGKDKNKFLCGHDERHWFAAAVPGVSVKDVKSAIAALKPAEVNQSFIRQGEWFFVPAPDVKDPDPFSLHQDGQIFKREILSRGRGSKPHVCQEILRRGGTVVMTSNAHPIGITQEEFNDLHGKAIAEKRERHFRLQNWMRQVRDAEVYARGWVRHSDHATINLDGWHRVSMSTERFAPHAQQIAFLD